MLQPMLQQIVELGDGFGCRAQHLQERFHHCPSFTPVWEGLLLSNFLIIFAGFFVRTVGGEGFEGHLVGEVGFKRASGTVVQIPGLNIHAGKNATG